VVSVFEPVRARALELLDDPAELDRILSANAERADALARPMMATVYDRIGFLPRR
jgi:tryptophanyl-tRNA synthetase